MAPGVSRNKLNNSSLNEKQCSRLFTFGLMFSPTRTLLVKKTKPKQNRNKCKKKHNRKKPVRGFIKNQRGVTTCRRTVLWMMALGAGVSAAPAGRKKLSCSFTTFSRNPPDSRELRVAATLAVFSVRFRHDALLFSFFYFSPRFFLQRGVILMCFLYKFYWCYYLFGDTNKKI